MSRSAIIFIALLLSACSSSKPFNPKSFYPPDPWVKGYANPDDCLGGEQLAAKRLDLPTYPRKPYRTGRQGWVILRLDVDVTGQTQNVEVERSLPDGMFSKSARRAVENWLFEPPKDGPMTACRVLLRYRLGAVSLGG
jgi:TonB family protein